MFKQKKALVLASLAIVKLLKQLLFLLCSYVKSSKKLP